MSKKRPASPRKIGDGIAAILQDNTFEDRNVTVSGKTKDVEFVINVDIKKLNDDTAFGFARKEKL